MGSKARRKKQARKPRERLDGGGSSGFFPYGEVIAVAGLEGLEAKPEKSPGRPTVPDNIMWGRLNDIAYLFETNWADIGWYVECLRNLPPRSPDDVRKAFEPLRGKHGHERIAFLLRPTLVPATCNDVRKTWMMLGKARQEQSELQRQYALLLEKFKLARRAAYEATTKHALEVKTEITRRLELRTQLKDDLAAWASATKKKVATVGVKPSRTAEAEVSEMRAQLESRRNSLQTEETIINTLKKQLEDCTDQNRALARTETRRCVRELRVVKAKIKESTDEVDRLQNLYDDQAAGFASQDLAKFLREKRARHHPRRLAKAVAGLPDMGCRESFDKCRHIGFGSEPHLNFQVIEVIATGVTRRKANDPAKLLESINESIQRVPKTRLYRGERVPNHLREYLVVNRRDLEHAIDSCSGLKPPLHPGELPYAITRKFLENVARPRTTLERLQTQQGQLSH